MECDIKYINDYEHTKVSPIEENLNGVADANDFMEYITTKADLEFIRDRDDSDSFTTVFLESTRESKEGVNYKLKEIRRLQGYFDTGLLIFRQKN
jgi:hypothetical protein